MLRPKAALARDVPLWSTTTVVLATGTARGETDEERSRLAGRRKEKCATFISNARTNRVSSREVGGAERDRGSPESVVDRGTERRTAPSVGRRSRDQAIRVRSMEACYDDEVRGGDMGGMLRHGLAATVASVTGVSP